MLLQNLCLFYLIVISFFDFKFGKIPDVITILFFIGMVCITFVSSKNNLPEQIFCSIFYFSLFLIIALITKGLGIGDAKLAAVIAFCSGFINTSIIFILASVAGLIFFSVLYLLKKRKKKIPYAPFVTVGYICSGILFRGIH